MADRSVSVELRLRAASYLAGMQAAKKATRDMADETLKATRQNHANLQQVGRAGLIAGGAIAAGLGTAVLAAAKFDKSLSGVKAVANATSREMADLRQAALDAGRATVFSASESAQAEAELAKAGVSVGDILGGALRGSLDLAAAGQLDLADAATIAAQAMNIFKLRGSDVGHVADVLAAGANKSAADVGQLGDALRQGGLLAAQTGLSLEDTVGALSAFADNALVGSDAGTSLKTMLQRLVPQSDKAQAAMDSIGFSAYDAQGNFVGLESVAQQLQEGLGKLTAEQRASTLSIIFGSDAVRAANVLYDQGAAGIADYVGAVDDAGAASRMAATQLDNLAGDFEQLKGSIETALIQTGSAGDSSLRDLTQAATGAVNAFSGLPGPIQKAGFFTAALSAGLLLTAGALGTMVPKVRAARSALIGLGAAGAAADKGLGKIGRFAGTAAVAAAAIAAIGQAFNGADGGFERFTQRLEAGAGATPQSKIRALTKEMQRYRDIANEGSNAFHPRSFTIGGTTLRPLDFTGGQSAAADKADDLLGRIKELRQEMRVSKAEAEAAAATQTNFGVSLDGTSVAAQAAADAILAYSNSLDASTAAINAYTASAELRDSFKGLIKDLKDGGEVTDAEQVKLGSFASQVVATTQNVLDSTNNQDKANKKMREGRKDFIAAAEAAGYTARQAKNLADRLLEIPAKTDVYINGDGIDDALRKARQLARILERIGVERSVAIGTVNRLNGRGPAFADGGMVYGPGTSRSDSIPALLSNGEFVVNAASTSANRGLLEAINSGHASRFANGGLVRGGPSYSSGSHTGVNIERGAFQVVAPDPVTAAHMVVSSLSDDVWKRGGWDYS